MAQLYLNLNHMKPLQWMNGDIYWVGKLPNYRNQIAEFEKNDGSVKFASSAVRCSQVVPS